MQIYCLIFLDLEGKQYICTQQYTEVQKDLLSQEKDVSAAPCSRERWRRSLGTAYAAGQVRIVLSQRKRTDLLHRQLR